MGGNQLMIFTHRKKKTKNDSFQIAIIINIWITIILPITMLCVCVWLITRSFNSRTDDWSMSCGEFRYGFFFNFRVVFVQYDGVSIKRMIEKILGERRMKNSSVWEKNGGICSTFDSSITSRRPHCGKIIISTRDVLVWYACIESIIPLQNDGTVHVLVCVNDFLPLAISHPLYVCTMGNRSRALIHFKNHIEIILIWIQFVARPFFRVCKTSERCILWATLIFGLAENWKVHTNSEREKKKQRKKNTHNKRTQREHVEDEHHHHHYHYIIIIRFLKRCL